MSTTVQAVIARGITKSFANAPATSPANTAELIDVVYRGLVWIFDAISIESTAYLETTVAVSPSGGGWPVPSDSYAAHQLELTTGEEVVVVPYRQRTIEAGLRPAVYERNGYWFPAGNPNDPDPTDQLFVVHSPGPSRPAVVGDTVDPRLPDKYMAALEYVVAAFLARKDNRPQEASGFDEEAKGWLTLILAHVQRRSMSEVRHSGYPVRIPSKHNRPAPERE